ncbi:flagellar hook-associated protein 3 [Acidobacteria bacterium AB60]|nr:flagellar hook-associated protein 3 [Acidobacteria bacterium AB60]
MKPPPSLRWSAVIRRHRRSSPSSTLSWPRLSTWAARPPSPEPFAKEHMRVDPHYVTGLVAALNTAQASTQQLSSQLSSGVRVTSLSADPLAAGENVRLLNQMQQDDSFTQSANLVTGQLQVADSALGQVVTQLTQAVSLATSANNGTMNASNRQSIANQIAGIRGEILTLANSSYQGQYIFAGTATSAPPFTLDNSTTPATINYAGNQIVNYLQTPGGQKIQLNLPGTEIFDGPGASVLAALNSLVADYSNPAFNVAAAINDTQALSTSLNFVSQQRVILDNATTQLTDSSNAVTAERTQLTAAQTTLMQADIPQIATQLSLSETQQTALEAVIARLGSGSLFDKM